MFSTSGPSFALRMQAGVELDASKQPRGSCAGEHAAFNGPDAGTSGFLRGSWGRV